MGYMYISKEVYADLTDKHGIEHGDCTISFSYLPLIPGRFSGPPEDCYPDEGDEIDDINVFNHAGVDATDDFDMDYIEKMAREKMD